MKGRLFIKIFATYLAITVLAIGIVGFLAGSQIRAKLEKQIEIELMSFAGLVDLYPMKEIQSHVERDRARSPGRVSPSSTGRERSLPRRTRKRPPWGATWSARRSRRLASAAGDRQPVTAAR